jgi:hypothetical protein
MNDTPSVSITDNVLYSRGFKKTKSQNVKKSIKQKKNKKNKYIYNADEGGIRGGGKYMVNRI